MTVPVVLLQQNIGQNIPRVINNILGNVIEFIPRLAWAIAVLAVGVFAASWLEDRAEDHVEYSDVVADWLADPFAYGVKVLVMFFAVAMALSELGLNTGVLVVFLDGIAFGLGVGAALVAGIAIGWGSKDYVAEHVEEWIQDVVEDEHDASE